MAAKINERLKDLLEAGQGTAMGMATGMSPQRALLSTAGDMMLTKVLGPAAGVATMIALFVFGAVNGYTPLMVISGTLAVVLVTVGVSVQVSLDRRLAAVKAGR